MKCPTCHAKLLPVPGELFCLQCGAVWSSRQALPDNAPDVPPPLLAAPGASAPAARPLLAPPPATTGRPRRSAGPARPAIVDLRSPAPATSQVTGWHRRQWPRGLVVGLVLVALLAATDGLARWYYAGRVYPGVKVAGQALGGRSLAGVESALQQSWGQDKIQLTIDTTDYAFTVADLGVSIDAARLADDAKAQGRAEPLALVGAVQTLASRPLPLEYQVHQATLDALVAQLAARHSHPAADAQPLIVGTTPLVLAEKPGQVIDQTKLRESLLLAVRNHQHVTVSSSRVAPALAASAYAADLDDARAKLAVSLSLKVKTRTVTPAPADIAGWLSFGEPGSGAHVDAGRVGAYVAAVPGSFDRAATQAAIVAALAAHQPLAYTASTKKNIAPSSTAPATPGAPAAYRYCVAGRSVDDAAVGTLADRSAATLALAQGWSLGGHLAYTAVPSGCNFTLWLAADSQMTAFSPACNHQATCRVGNDVIINAARWATPPADWKGPADDYRTELINHEVGHWLGFDHPSCAPGVATDSPLSQVTLTVAGCSPSWHPIPAELQGLKILPGF
jgi:hypothetical protein